MYEEHKHPTYLYYCYVYYISLHCFRSHLTVAEIIEVLEEEGEVSGNPTIFITPPDDGTVTDCDSGDEDCNDPNKLSGSQLRAHAELVIESNSISNSIATEIENTELAYSNQSGPRPQKIPKLAKPKKPDWKWEKCDLDSPKVVITKQPETLPMTFSEQSHPIDFFLSIFTEEIVDTIARQSILYAASKGVFNISISVDELYCFIGILFLSGYVPLPRRRMFWEENDDSHNLLVSKSMRRNRFEELFRYLHVADNSNLQEGDKMAKLRPLIESLNKQFIKLAPMETNLSIDESMIPYFGRHGCKQFIRGKPIRFGFKAWVLAQKLGYCVSFDIYQGRDQRKSEIGLRESVVCDFVELIKTEFPGITFSMYFDNFFTSASLISRLGKLNVGATGTVRDNRTNKCPLIDSKTMKKKCKRGDYESYVCKEEGVVAVRWNDNSVVTVLSNVTGVHPLHKAKRYSFAEKKKIDIAQPDVISKYNYSMGGVDQLDNNISNYRIAMRGKKWYMPILLWMLDVGMNNAWLLSRNQGLQIDNLNFRRQVVRALLQKYRVPPAALGPFPERKLRISVSEASRNDPKNHLIIPNQPRRRCALCKNKTTKMCQRCTVPLHNKCFVTYHK